MEPSDNIKKKLEKLKDNAQFNIPEDYFEKLPGNIMDRIKQNESEFKKTGIIQRLKPQLAIAASVAALALIAFSAIKIVSENNNRVIPTEEIMLALENEIYYLDETYMLNLMDDNSSQIVYDIELTNEDIIKYLSENGSELDFMETEF